MVREEDCEAQDCLPGGGPRSEEPEAGRRERAGRGTSLSYLLLRSSPAYLVVGKGVDACVCVRVRVEGRGHEEREGRHKVRMLARKSAARSTRRPCQWGVGTLPEGGGHAPGAPFPHPRR